MGIQTAERKRERERERSLSLSYHICNYVITSIVIVIMFLDHTLN